VGGYREDPPSDRIGLEVSGPVKDIAARDVTADGMTADPDIVMEGQSVRLDRHLT
jgi:hypothetical protein